MNLRCNGTLIHGLALAALLAGLATSTPAQSAFYCYSARGDDPEALWRNFPRLTPLRNLMTSVNFDINGTIRVDTSTDPITIEATGNGLPDASVDLFLAAPLYTQYPTPSPLLTANRNKLAALLGCLERQPLR